MKKKKFFEIMVIVGIWLATVGVVTFILPPDWWPIKSIGAQLALFVGSGSSIAYVLGRRDAGGYAVYFLTFSALVYVGHFLGLPWFVP